MKKCKFCGQILSDSDRNCSSCGANQFVYICANCGNEFENGLHCPRCGVKVGQAEKICPRCGNHYFTNACGNCGYSELNRNVVQAPVIPAPVYVQQTQRVIVQSAPQATGKPKSKGVALILWLLLGIIGAHKFYEGKIGMGILYLFTGGLFGFGWFIDFFSLLAKPSTYYV